MTNAGNAWRAVTQGPAKEHEMAKGQKKSNREIRKPKADKPKPAAATRDFLAPLKKKK
jgi:hypothetical protein